MAAVHHPASRYHPYDTDTSQKKESIRTTFRTATDGSSFGYRHSWLGRHAHPLCQSFNSFRPNNWLCQRLLLHSSGGYSLPAIRPPRSVVVVVVVFFVVVPSDSAATNRPPVAKRTKAKTKPNQGGSAIPIFSGIVIATISRQQGSIIVIIIMVAHSLIPRQRYYGFCSSSTNSTAAVFRGCGNDNNSSNGIRSRIERFATQSIASGPGSVP